MGARAESAAATGERILDAVAALFWEQPADRISLDEVGRCAGVSVQTVIRRFGTKELLFAAAAEREVARVRAQRDTAPVGDLRAVVAVLAEHYEQFGDRVLKLLAEEGRMPALREIADRGRELHREWCARVFAPALIGLRGVARARRLAQLVAVCDVQTWKLLRHDCGLSRRQVELALVEMLEPLASAGSS
jgi:AcrR family transcriptional regulator